MRQHLWCSGLDLAYAIAGNAVDPIDHFQSSATAVVLFRMPMRPRRPIPLSSVARAVELLD